MQRRAPGVPCDARGATGGKRCTANLAAGGAPRPRGLNGAGTPSRIVHLRLVALRSSHHMLTPARPVAVSVAGRPIADLSHYESQAGRLGEFRRPAPVCRCPRRSGSVLPVGCQCGCLARGSLGLASGHLAWGNEWGNGTGIPSAGRTRFIPKAKLVPAPHRASPSAVRTAPRSWTVGGRNRRWRMRSRGRSLTGSTAPGSAYGSARQMIQRRSGDGSLAAASVRATRK